MDGICPVCGCKTDELDFTEYRFGTKEERICSYCKKQLDPLGAGSSAWVTDAQLRWLNGVLQKEVPGRKSGITRYLTELYGSIAPPDEAEEGLQAVPAEEEIPSVAPRGTGRTAPYRTPRMKSDDGDTENVTIEQLSQRLTALEKDYRHYRKMMRIYAGLEVAIPILLIIIILIIFFKSGLYGNLKGLFNMYQDFSGGGTDITGYSNLFGK